MNINNKAQRILCYGDSNTWGWVPLGLGLQRYSIEKRWPGILQGLLGKNYEVIEEGLGGRTTMFDDPRPEFPDRNGLKILPIILETHLPLDLVILMLGTTDTKEMLHLSSGKIVEGMQGLVRAIKTHKVLNGFSVPRILIVVPPLVKEETDFALELFKGASQKTTELIEAYKKLAESEQVFYLDPTALVKVNNAEGLHLDLESQQKLAELISEKIRKI